MRSGVRVETHIQSEPGQYDGVTGLWAIASPRWLRWLQGEKGDGKLDDDGQDAAHVFAGVRTHAVHLPGPCTQKLVFRIVRRVICAHRHRQVLTQSQRPVGWVAAETTDSATRTNMSEVVAPQNPNSI